MHELYNHKIQVLIRGRAHHQSGYTPYLQYLEHLRSQLFPLSEEERFEAPYYDYLQAPLQPLMDNLESQTVRAGDLSRSWQQPYGGCYYHRKTV